MDSNREDNTFERGMVEFIQHNIPGLDPGLYTVGIEQRIKITRPDQPETLETYQNKYLFAVKGEHYVLAPDAINSRLPSG